MNAATTLLQQPFFQITVPLLIGLFLAAWLQNKRFDDVNGRFSDLRSDLNRRLDEITQSLKRIEQKLDNHEGRIITLEERTSPIGRAR